MFLCVLAKICISLYLLARFNPHFVNSCSILKFARAMYTICQHKFLMWKVLNVFMWKAAKALQVNTWNARICSAATESLRWLALYFGDIFYYFVRTLSCLRQYAPRNCWEVVYLLTLTEHFNDYSENWLPNNSTNSEKVCFQFQFQCLVFLLYFAATPKRWTKRAFRKEQHHWALTVWNHLVVKIVC